MSVPDLSKRDELARLVKSVTLRFGGPHMVEFANDPPIAKHYAIADAVLDWLKPEAEPEEWLYGVSFIYRHPERQALVKFDSLAAARAHLNRIVAAPAPAIFPESAHLVRCPMTSWGPVPVEEAGQ